MCYTDVSVSMKLWHKIMVGARDSLGRRRSKEGKERVRQDEWDRARGTVTRMVSITDEEGRECTTRDRKREREERRGLGVCTSSVCLSGHLALRVDAVSRVASGASPISMV